MPPPDEPPRRRTPPGSGGGQHGPVLPRPSQPDLYELFESWLREFGGEHREGISNRSIMDAVNMLGAKLDEAERARTAFEQGIIDRVSNLEGARAARDQFDARSTGSFVLPAPAAAPTPAKSHSSFFGRFGTTLGEQIAKALIPVILTAVAAYSVGHGCHP